MSSASQLLAEGTGQQASAIEETSASLEEMSAMIRQNAGMANQAFGLVSIGASRASDLINGIANASGQQDQGIGQINSAISDMDQIIQQNAANAEESASASEALSAQAIEMKSIVAQLTDMVGN